MRMKRIFALAGLGVVLGQLSGAVYASPNEPFIIGGRPYNNSDFRWQVSLRITYPDGSVGRCGGSIIAAGYVLTAAHCVDSVDDDRLVGQDAPAPNFFPPSAIKVIVGATRLSQGGQMVEVAEIIPHDKWKTTTIPLDFDAAVLKLTTQVDPARAIKLYRNTLTAEDGEAWVSGWGRTEHGTLSDSLLAAKVPIVAEPICARPGSYGGLLSAQMVCAGFAGGDKDSCSGDSGGPLTMGASRQELLVGIVSWGHGCGQPDKYGVYTRLNAIGGWIDLVTARAAIWSSPITRPLFDRQPLPGNIIVLQDR